MPRDTSVILSEETASTGTGVSFFRCHLSEVGKQSQRLARVCPKWVSDCVLKVCPLWLLFYTRSILKCLMKPFVSLHQGLYFPKDVTKMSFVLNSENEKKISNLPPSERRLSAFRILRVKKIIHYLSTKIKLDEGNPEQLLEILCNDQILPLNMNLGTIKMCIWKSSAELQLVYRYSTTKK